MLLERKAMTNIDSILKRRHYFAHKGPYSPSCGFSSSHVWMWELEHKEGWIPKSRCLQTMVLEKTLDGPLYCNEIKPVDLKGNQSWIFNGRTDAEAEAPRSWSTNAKSWLTRKAPDVGKYWMHRRRRLQRTRWLDGVTYSMDMSLSKLWGMVKDRGSLACCSPKGHKESDTTKWLNNNSWDQSDLEFSNEEVL